MTGSGDSDISLRSHEPLKPVWSKLDALFEELLRHRGFGKIEIDVKWLKRGQKEVILSCGKQYRFIVPVEEIEPPATAEGKGARQT